MINVKTSDECREILVEPTNEALIALKVFTFGARWEDRTYHVRRLADHDGWFIDFGAGGAWEWRPSWIRVVELIARMLPSQLEILECS